MHRILLLLLALFALPQAAALQPFTASYAADWEGSPVGGTAGRSLKALADGRWELGTQARILVASLSAVSILRVDGASVQPLNYRFRRSALGRTRETEYEFDWAAAELRGSDKGEPVRLALRPGMHDKSSYLLALQEEATAGKKTMSYQVVDGKEIRVYDFRVLGEERVRTGAGWVDAIKVERVRDPASAARKTVLWFARDWGGLLVRLQQVEKDGKVYTFMLKEGTVNGRRVAGSKD